MARLESLVRSLRLGPQGRLVIPADLRRHLGISPGDTHVAWTEDDRLVLRPRRAVEEELRAWFASLEGSLVDELLAERRREVARGS